MPRRRAQDDEHQEDAALEEEVESSDVDEDNDPDDETELEAGYDDSDEEDDDLEEDEDEAFDDSDDEDEYDEEGEGEDEEQDDPTPLTVTGRISQAFGLPPKSRPAQAKASQQPKMSDKEKATAIRQVDQLERRVGFAGAALTLLIGLIFFIPYIKNPKRTIAEQVSKVGKHCPPKSKFVVNACIKNVTFTRSHWIGELAIVAVFAVLLAVATWYGRRSLLAFALVFSGLAVVQTTGSILGILFVGAGGWLLVRAHRMQRYGTTSGKEVAAIAAKQRAERKTGSASGSGGGTKSARASKGSSTAKASRETKPSKDAKAAPTDGKRKPEANKRYTPKTPPRKRPVAPSD